MTDRELDRMMQHVLLDAIKCDCEKELDDIPAFKPTNNYQRQMAAMLSDPLKWARNRARPIWKSALQKVAMILLLFSLSLGGLMAVNPTARAAVVRWVTEWYRTILSIDTPENRFPEKCSNMKSQICQRAILRMNV